MLQAFGRMRKMKWTEDERRTAQLKITEDQQKMLNEEILLINKQLPSILLSTRNDEDDEQQQTQPNLEINNPSCSSQQHSPATSPGCSSTHSSRSFHLHFPSTMSSLRKSGINLVRNIPNNLRRSSLAMFQMGNVSITSLEEDSTNNNFKVQNSIEQSSTTTINNNNILEQNEKQNFQRIRYRGFGGMTILATRKKSGITSNSNCGAAKRAMRKRILAAKSALRRLSNTSSSSNVPTSSSDLSTSTIMAKGLFCNGEDELELWHHQTNPVKFVEEKREFKLKNIFKANCENEEEDDEFCGGNNLVKEEKRKISRREEENKEEIYGEEEEKEMKIKKKKRSWAASFVPKKNSFNNNIEVKTQEKGKEGEEKLLKNNNRRKPLGPSLSWDPQQQRQIKEQRSVISSPGSQTSRSRIHSDGSTKKPSILSRENLWPFSSLGKSSFTSSEEKKENIKKQFYPQKKISTATLLGKKRKKSSSVVFCKRGNRSNSLSALSGDLLPIEDGVNKTALELNCLHCALLAEYRTSGLRAEIECAVKRLAARLTFSGSPARARRMFADHHHHHQQQQREKKTLEENERQMEMLRRQMGTPDIVVSSCNSEGTPESADEGFWTNPSPQHVEGSNCGNDRWNTLNNQELTTTTITSGIPSSLSSTNSPQHSGGGDLLIQDRRFVKNDGGNIIMDTLKPPGFPFGIPLLSNSSPSNSSSFSPCYTSNCSSIDNGGLNQCSSPPRSNSVDLSQLRRDIELWSVSSLSSAEAGSSTGERTAGISTPGGDSIRTVRSRSFDPSGSPDCVLRRPSRIEHLSEIFRKALAKSPVVKRAAALQEQEQKRATKHRTSRYWLEEQINSSEHIWLPSCSISSSTNVDTECYLGETDCGRIGEKRRCAACHIVAHTACFPLLAKMNLNCKSTYRDCQTNRRQHCRDGQDSLYKHHWVHRWRLEGRCFHCGKSFQQKMFREKEVIAINCSWCKRSYHNKRSCFSLARFDDRCDRGILRELILPPNWLLRLSNQRRNNRLNEQQTSNNIVAISLKRNRKKYRPFIVKFLEQTTNNVGPIPLIGGTRDEASNSQQPPIQPLLAFVNPKSGGNKGAKALNTLCWLLNPRQVFDINTMNGPKYGLEIFRKITNQMRILVCGGDGTVGWLLSTLDQLNWNIYPPIAILPLGTGNDLSRSMGWGGTFSDEPLSEILQAIQTETSVTFLDRWRLDVFPLSSTNNLQQEQQQSTSNNLNSPTFLNENNENKEQQLNNECQTTLPLSVMNNYFSIGADAHVALQFHHSRSANPQMLNSRLKNRLAYGGLGTIDLFKRAWKDLSEYITVECDGVDITPKIREFKFHCILFHNISFYAGGTVPWGQGGDGVQESCGEVFSRPSPCDGKIEVLGFTTATLATLQMGGRGERIAQCSNVRIETIKPIPMQVDGEPCLLGPSLIHLSFHNKVPMLRREKFARLSGSAPTNNIVSMNANRRRKNSNQNNNIAINTNNNLISEQNDGNGLNLKSNNITSPININQHKNSKASLAAYPLNNTPQAPSPPNNVSVCVPIVVVGRHDYDTYRDSVDRLKDTGFELGTLVLEAELELSQVREKIQKMLSQHQILPYEPGKDWRFLDYVSSPEEGTFRISNQQEHCRTVADVSSLDETNSAILILDDAFPSMTVRSAAIGHELVFNPAGGKQAKTSNEKNNLMRRRIGETLRIVLSTDSQETHL